MSGVTSRLGLGGTYSTTYYEPFHVARLFATLDLMTRGRAAWNVVTSLNDSEAANFGRTEHLEHDLRYDRADEFMEAVLGHWDSWEDDAIILDKATGRFADGDKVHALKHEGRFFRTHGPLPVPRSPQGHPVLIQAGQSGRGRRFAGRWGELIFVVYPNLAAGQKQYADLKAAVAEAGRDPDSVAVAPACYVNVAETAAQAEEKRAYHRGAGQAGGCGGAAVRGAEFRLRLEGHGQRVHRCRAGQAVLDRLQGPHRPAQRQAEPDDPRLREILRPRHDAGIPELHRHAGAGRRPDAGMVRGPRLRRLRPRCLAIPGILRGFHPAGGARNCSAAGCTTATMPARRCARTWVWQGRAPAHGRTHADDPASWTPRCSAACALPSPRPWSTRSRPGRRGRCASSSPMPRAAAPTSPPAPSPKRSANASARPSWWRTAPAPMAWSAPRRWPARRPMATRCSPSPARM